MSLVGTLRELGLFVLDNKRYARQRTVQGRRLFNKMYKALHARTYAKRRRLCHAIEPVFHGLTIPEEVGFTLWRPSSFRLLEDAIAEANAHFDAADLDALTRAMTVDIPFTHIPVTIRAESAIARLATHPAFIRPFAEYLGVVPILHTLQLMYSPNHRLVQGSSQYYHLDGQDVKSLQVFIYLHDVTEDNGPLTLVEAQATERVADALRYRKATMSRRIDDEIVQRHVNMSHEVHVMTGKGGSVLVFDGDRCFHYGSRKATRPRRILHYAYVTPFAFTLPPRWWTRFSHLIQKDAPEWQRSVVEKT